MHGDERGKAARTLLRGKDLNLGSSGYEPDSWGTAIEEFQ